MQADSAVTLAVVAFFTTFCTVVFAALMKSQARAEASKEKGAEAQERIHLGYQESQQKLAIAINNQTQAFTESLSALDATVKAMQAELREVRKQAKCNAPKPKRASAQ